MKRNLAFLLAFMMIIFTFTACGSNTIVDKEGNEHNVVVEKGEYVQDKLGNLIEEVTNAEGEKVTQPVSFPDVIQNSKKEIENAFFKVKIPSGWKYDETVKVFRIQHEDKCKETESGVCELSFDSSSTGDVDILYKYAFAKEQAVNLYQPEFVTGFEEFETKLFDKDVKAYKCKYDSGVSIYYYAFEHAYSALSIRLIVNDACLDKLSPEEFISKNVTLKSFE